MIMAQNTQYRQYGASLDEKVVRGHDASGIYCHTYEFFPTSGDQSSTRRHNDDHSSAPQHIASQSDASGNQLRTNKIYPATAAHENPYFSSENIPLANTSSVAAPLETTHQLSIPILPSYRDSQVSITDLKSQKHATGNAEGQPIYSPESGPSSAPDVSSPPPVSLQGWTPTMPYYYPQSTIHGAYPPLSYYHPPYAGAAYSMPYSTHSHRQSLTGADLPSHQYPYQAWQYDACRDAHAHERSTILDASTALGATPDNLSKDNPASPSGLVPKAPNLISLSQRYACKACIRGHRAPSCRHTDRQLFPIRPRGRPSNQCPNCKDLRKNSGSHARCVCNGANFQAPGTVSHASVSGHNTDPTNSFMNWPRTSAMPNTAGAVAENPMFYSSTSHTGFYPGYYPYYTSPMYPQTVGSENMDNINAGQYRCSCPPNMACLCGKRFAAGKNLSA
jgi:hypothetical protein